MPAKEAVRPRSDAESARNARKRAKTTKEKSENDSALLREYFTAAWDKKLEARQQVLEILCSTFDPESPTKSLVDVLNGIRIADCRPKLDQRASSLLPTDPDFSTCFLKLFQNPYKFDPAKWPTILHPASESDSDEDCDLAQYYLRRLSFDSHAALKAFLESVIAKKKQYAGHARVLVEVSAEAGKGARSLFYGGYTIATSPVGRQADDEEAAEEGFLHAALGVFTGSVDVFEAKQLAFATGGKDTTACVKISRADERTALFESVIIDSLGFLCLNTAPAGFLDIDLDDDMLELVVIDSAANTSSKGKGKAKASAQS